MWQTQNKFSQGFTLLEMLIAIAIFAMLGIAANAVLQTVMTNDDTTKAFASKLKTMQQGFGVIQRDLSQMVARTPRLLEGGRANGIFQAGPNVLDSQSEGLAFFRIGWLNPQGILPRGSVQAVAYVQVEDRLERWFFPYPDPELSAEPQKTLLMKGVLNVKYSFFINGSWQKEANGKVMPHAIAIEVEFADLGKIQRKFLLPELGFINASDGQENLVPNNPADRDSSSRGNGSYGPTSSGQQRPYR